MADIVYLKDYKDKLQKKKVDGLEDLALRAFYSKKLPEVMASGKSLYHIDQNNTLALSILSVEQYELKNYSSAASFLEDAVTSPEEPKRESLLMMFKVLNGLSEKKFIYLDIARLLIDKVLDKYKDDADMLEQCLRTSIGIMFDTERTRRLYEMGLKRNPGRFRNFEKDVLALGRQHLRVIDDDDLN